MAWKVKRFFFCDLNGTPLNQTSEIIGIDSTEVYLRLELDAVGGAAMPDSVPIQISFREPGKHPKAGLPLAAPITTTLTRTGKTSLYKGMTLGERVLNATNFHEKNKTFATVARTGGTSDRKFRGVLEGLGWGFRGAATQPAPGKPDKTGDVMTERPDARALFGAGGVVVLEAEILRPTDKAFAGLPTARAWIFARCPADVFFYTGHGAWWSGCLLREQAGHSYDDWMHPGEIKNKWAGMSGSMDMNVLIINGCSVLFHNARNEQLDSNQRGNWAKDWSRLLVGGDSDNSGRLLAILGYRSTAPLDDPWGDRIATEFAGKMNALGDHWGLYPRAWLELNAQYEATRTAAAVDTSGYWYINNPPIKRGNEVVDPHLSYGHDPSKPAGAIIGPIKIT